MSNTNDISRYVTRVDDGLIRPMTVRELMSRLNELISIDKSIARMPVGLSTDAEGNMIYVPRVFIPNDSEKNDGYTSFADLVGVLTDEDCAYYRVPKCVVIG